MKAVSQQYKDAWAKKSKVVDVQVQYKRRYWNGSAYVYESNWTTISKSKFPKVGNIQWKLDTPLLNAVSISNVSIFLNDLDYQWLPSNTASPSYWAADATATLGYEPDQSQFRVNWGYVKADGSTEYVTIFSGLAIDYLPAQDGTLEVVLVGWEQTLVAADAQKVSTAFSASATSPATGDGSNKNFSTTDLGVASITAVYDNGVKKAQGTDYTVSGLSTYNAAASISFVAAPVAGHTITYDGTKWKTLQTIDSLVGQLCDQAGITSSQRTINAALFPGGVSTTKQYNTLADWLNATDSDVEADPNVPGGGQVVCVDGFSLSEAAGLDYGISAPFGGSSFAWNAAGYVEKVDGSSASGDETAYKNTAGLRSCGLWGFDFRYPAYASDNGTYPQVVTMSFFGGVLNFYELRFKKSGANISVNFNTGQSGVGGFTTTLATFTYAYDNNFHTFLITRDAAGNWVIKLDGATKVSLNNAAYNILSGLAFSFSQVLDTYTVTPAFKNTFVNNTLSVNEITPAFDAGSVSAWGTFVLNNVSVPSGCAITIYTQTSTLNAPFNDPDGWKALGPGSAIQSALRRYIKFKLVFSRVSYGQVLSVGSATLFFTTQTVTLAMANFASKTCFDAIQRLAQMCDYEWGFDATGTFFFRSKNVSATPVLSIDQATVIGQITQFNQGYQDVLNDAQITYGQYYSEYSCTTAAEAHPNPQDRFGSLILQESWSDIFLAYDQNIAAARAQLIHDNNHKPRRRLKVKGKIAPHLDLSDVLSVSFFQDPLKKDVVWGDPLQVWGQAAYGTPMDVLLRSMPAKIIGMNLDPSTGTGELELREVI